MQIALVGLECSRENVSAGLWWCTIPLELEPLLRIALEACRHIIAYLLQLFVV